MLNRKLVIFFALIFVTLQTFAEDKKESLKIAFLSADLLQIKALADWANLFEAQNPNIEVSIQPFSDENFKQKIPTWIETGEFDLLHWQAGERLSRLVKNELITPINSVIDLQNLTNNIPSSSLKQVTYDGLIYGQPFAHYAWGFYYNLEIFAELNLTPPTTWEEFISISHKLNSHGIKPFVQANKYGWESLIWMDYLSLATGGLALRDKLVKHQEPFTASEQQAFKLKLAQLLDQKLFLSPEYAWSWQQTIYSVIRKQAAMTFMGQFAENILQNNNQSKLGFFPFPESSGKHLVAPIDLLILPTSSKKQQIAKYFLEFILEPNTQAEFAHSLGMLPLATTKNHREKFNPREIVAMDYLQNTQVHQQYFDRDASEAWSVKLGNTWSSAIIAQDTNLLMDAIANLSTDKDIQINYEKPSDTIHLSGLTGNKGSFSISKILNKVYEKLGYKVLVTRFKTNKETIDSQRLGMDGELARIKYFEKINSDLIMVPEPLFTTGVYLFNNKEFCNSSNVENFESPKIGVSSDALAMQNWAKENQVSLHRFKDSHLMREALKNKEIGAVLLFETDLAEYNNLDKGNCASRVMDLDFFHYVNKKHQKLISPLVKSIREVKNSAAYHKIIEDLRVKSK